MMAKNDKKTEQFSLWTCFTCEAVLYQEINFHYHQNICLYNLTRSNKADMRARKTPSLLLSIDMLGQVLCIENIMEMIMPPHLQTYTSILLSHEN